MTTPPQHRWEVAARRELDPAEGGHCCLERGPVFRLVDAAVVRVA